MKKLVLAVAALSLATNVSAAAFDGIYAGINAGLTKGGTKLTVTRNSDKAARSQGLSKTSMTFGAQVGYAVTFANSMFAAGELSLNYDGMAKKKATTDLSGLGLSSQSSAKMNKQYTAALAAKGGYNFGAGVAYLGGFVGMSGYKTSSSTTVAANNAALANKKTLRAVVFGPLVGAEFKITDSITAGLEGRFGFTRKKSSAETSSYAIKTKVNNDYSVVARLNYAF